jgi:hypothetical protein
MNSIDDNQPNPRVLRISEKLLRWRTEMLLAWKVMTVTLIITLMPTTVQCSNIGQIYIVG